MKVVRADRGRSGNNAAAAAADKQRRDRERAQARSRLARANPDGAPRPRLSADAHAANTQRLADRLAQARDRARQARTVADRPVSGSVRAWETRQRLAAGADAEVKRLERRTEQGARRQGQVAPPAGRGPATGAEQRGAGRELPRFSPRTRQSVDARAANESRAAHLLREAQDRAERARAVAGRPVSGSVRAWETRQRQAAEAEADLRGLRRQNLVRQAQQTPYIGPRALEVRQEIERAAGPARAEADRLARLRDAGPTGSVRGWETTRRLAAEAHAEATRLERLRDLGAKTAPQAPRGRPAPPPPRERQLPPWALGSPESFNALDEAKVTVEEMATDVVELARDTEDALGLGFDTDEREQRAAQDRLRQRGEAVARMAQNPSELVDAVVQPYREDWNSDQPERVIGRAAVEAGASVAGGAGIVAKLIRVIGKADGPGTPEPSRAPVNPPNRADAPDNAPTAGQNPPATPPQAQGGQAETPSTQNPTAPAPTATPPTATTPDGGTTGARGGGNGIDATRPATPPVPPDRPSGNHTGTDARAGTNPQAQTPDRPRRTPAGNNPSGGGSPIGGRDSGEQPEKLRKPPRDTVRPPMDRDSSATSGSKPESSSPDSRQSPRKPTLGDGPAPTRQPVSRRDTEPERTSPDRRRPDRPDATPRTPETRPGKPEASRRPGERPDHSSPGTSKGGSSDKPHHTNDTAASEGERAASPKRSEDRSSPHPELTPAERVALDGRLSELEAKYPERFAETSRDPDHNGKVRRGSQDEARIALDLEERGFGQFGRPKDPDTGELLPGKGDFVDQDGRAWDVKGAHSDWPPEVPDRVKNGRPFRDAYTEKWFRDTVKDQFAKGRNVIMDTRNASAADIRNMKKIVDEEGWGGRIIWYP